MAGRNSIQDALRAFVEAVKNGALSAPEHSYE
jgi:hypothetical protein